MAENLANLKKTGGSGGFDLKPENLMYMSTEYSYNYNPYIRYDVQNPYGAGAPGPAYGYKFQNFEIGKKYVFIYANPKSQYSITAAPSIISGGTIIDLKYDQYCVVMTFTVNNTSSTIFEVPVSSTGGAYVRPIMVFRLDD